MEPIESDDASDNLEALIDHLDKHLDEEFVITHDGDRVAVLISYERAKFLLESLES